MAILGIVEKQPREIVDFDIDYTSTLEGRSDTISTVTSEVTPAGLVLVSTVADIPSNKVKVVISSGTDAVTYTVTVLCTTTGGLKFEDEVTVIVEEV